jgi:hypothetical protein
VSKSLDQQNINPTFFEPAQAGRSLKEVGIDYLKVESKNITSRWFHSAHDVDLFLWLDEHSQVIKQQVSFCGQIVEWNVLDGLKTGVVIEEEVWSGDGNENKIDQSEIIRFDQRPQKQAIKLAIEVIQNIESLEDFVRGHLLSNFGVKSGFKPFLVKTTPEQSKASFWQRFLNFFKK